MKKLGLLVIPVIAIAFLTNCNKPSFTITWVNGDGKILEVDEKVKQGTIPTYDGPTPYKLPNDEYRYTFKAWDHEVTKATKSDTYTATYNSLNVDGADAWVTLDIPEDNFTFYFNYQTEKEIEVDWGDGDKTTSITNDKNGSASHKYDKAGVYEVKIKNISCFINARYQSDYIKKLYFSSEITAFDSFSGDLDEIMSFEVSTDNVDFDSRENCNAIITSRAVKIYPANMLLYGCNTTIIPNTVTSIKFKAFEANAYLSSITIPSSVTKINNEPFYQCPSLRSIVVEEDNPVYDSRNNCNAIITKKDVDDVPANTLVVGCNGTTIPNSVISIGESAFTEFSISSITIPNSVTSIGGYAFSFCKSLTSIKIPKSVNIIKELAFAFCSSLSLVDLTDFNEESDIPELELSGERYYPFDHCSDDLKFKVTSKDMAQKFIDSGKNWPNDLTKYDYPS